MVSTMTLPRKAKQAHAEHMPKAPNGSEDAGHANTTTTVGLDPAKSVFQVHDNDAPFTIPLADD
jgi:hypothetical protein